MQPGDTTAPSPSAPYKWGALAAVCVLMLYLVTLAPTTAMWDASEYIAAAKVLGLPHPPGNPLFVMLAHAFGMLPLPVSYAARINILAALCTAVTTGIWFLLIDHVLARGGVGLHRRRTIAAAGVLLGASAFTVWNQSVVNEKVYTVSLAFFAAITWLMILWLDKRGQRHNDKRLVAVAFLLGAGYCVHPAGLLPALAVIVTVAVIDWRKFLNWKLVLAVFGAFVLGLTPFIYEPIRAAQFPAMNEGAPTGCKTHIELACTFSSTTYERLAANINRDQYGKPPVTERQISFPAQVGMWWLYFKWQWLRDPHGSFPALQFLLALIFFGLGVYGAVVHWRWDRQSFWYWWTFIITLTLLLIYYLNFKYGYSQSPQLGDTVPREVRDRDYFYLWSYSVWSVWVALGIAGLWARSRYAAGLVALGVIPLLANWHSATRRNDTVARDWAVDLLNSVEPYSVVITNGDNDTFPLWYAQEVEGVRQDVTVVIGTYLGTDWFVRQLIRTPIPLYDATRGPALYRGKSWLVPTHPIFQMTTAQADAIPDYMELAQPQLFRSGNIEGRVAAGYITRDEIFVLRLLTDALPERPIYFSPGAPYVQRFGLGRYIVREGLMERMSPVPVGDSTASVLDVPGSLARWNIYGGPAAIIRRGDWIDRASLATPLDYGLLGLNLSEALAHQGDTAQARQVQDRTLAVIKGAHMQELFGVPVSAR